MILFKPKDIAVEVILQQLKPGDTIMFMKSPRIIVSTACGPGRGRYASKTYYFKFAKIKQSMYMTTMTSYNIHDMKAHFKGIIKLGQR